MALRITVASAILWIACACRPDEHSLLDRAIPVAVPNSIDLLLWAWKSDHELTYAQLPTLNKVGTLDANTGRVSSVVLAANPNSAPLSAQNPCLLEISPNGSFTVSVSFKPERTHVATMPGGKMHDVTGFRQTPGPSSDGSCLFSLTRGGLQVARPQELRPREFAMPRLTGYCALWYDGHDRIATIAGTASSEPTTRFTISSVSDPSSTHTYLMDLPAGAEFPEAILSPRGDRVLWRFVWQDDHPAWLTQVKDWLLRRSLDEAPTAYLEELRVSKPDGTEMKSLGRLHSQRASGALGGIQWMPDGKRICFQYMRRLYIMPVE